MPRSVCKRQIFFILIDFCEYKGQKYIQGQQWYDGCDFKCICEDGMTGVYRCSSRSGIIKCLSLYPSVCLVFLSVCVCFH